MPRNAISTGLVDYILPPEEMPAQLIAYVRHAFGKRPRPASAPPARTENTLKRICVLLRTQTGHDFSQYKQNTLIRRAERRMALNQIEQAELYLRHMQQNPAEVEALFHDLLIGVTSFFRDAEAFAALEQQVIPRLFAGKPSDSTVRVWVCGCSTGEEAYSIAILIQEYIETLRQTYKVQMFATDIDSQAIEQARSGTFSTSIAADVSPDRLSRFFVMESDGTGTPSTYRIHKVIRDLLVFSEQDLLRDPPFSKLDLISCRNLLIYLNGDLQKKVIPLFHYALNVGGILFLGTSETVGEFTSLFAPLDRKWRLYVRQGDLPGTTRPAFSEFIPPLSEIRPHQRPPWQEGRHEVKLNLRELTERALLGHYARTGVLINGRGEILHIYGRTGRYLEPAPGDVEVNILPMAREGLRQALTLALHKAVTKREIVCYPGLRVKTNGDYANVKLTVRPVTDISDAETWAGFFLVILEELPNAEPIDAVPAETAGKATTSVDARIAALEQELKAKDEYLQTTLEEMETSNEELKSTNEELQSVNEELETSKEELQSVNEELATVNAEMQTKIADLTRTNNDMNNLLAGTGIGTLFVDMELHISRFTPTITQVINLIQSDIGRPVRHIAANLVGYGSLIEDIQGVLDTLVPFEAEVQVKTGTWYLMRIRPYRTLDNVIEGVVLTFADITERKQMDAKILSRNAQLERRADERTDALTTANERLKAELASREQAERTIKEQLAGISSYYDNAPIGLAVLDADLRYLRINHLLAEMNGVPVDQHIGKTVQEVVPSVAKQARQVIARIHATGEPVTEEFTGETAAQPGVRRTWLEGWHPLRNAHDRITGFIVIVQDITERKQAQEALDQSG